MNLLLYSGQSYARLQTNAYIARVRADGGIVQKPEYVYEWYKLNYELGRLAGTTTALQWRRKYNALGGVKLNGISNTNLLLWSQAFDTATSGATWGKIGSTVTANQIANPLTGAVDADLMIANSGALIDSRVTQAVNLSASTVYTFSVFARLSNAAVVDGIQLQPTTGAGAVPTATFNLQTGTLTSTANSPLGTRIEPYGNGWYRVSITYDSSTGTLTARNHRIYNTFGGSTAFTGNGVDGLYLYGAQLQTGTIATDYILSEGTQGVATQNYVQTLYDFGTTSDARVNAAQATAANQPYWGLDDSLPSAVRGLVFDGSNDLMSVADLGIFNAQAAGTIIAVAKDANRTGGDGVHFVLLTTTATGVRRACITTRDTTDIFAVSGRRLDADAQVTVSASSANGLNYLAGLFIWGGNVLEGVFNGTATATSTYSSGAGITSATNSTLFNIGALTSASSRLQGIITDVSVGRIAASSAQLAALRSLEKAFYPALP